jgi:parvulin-like peptidyl-prolyl isomerase
MTAITNRRKLMKVRALSIIPLLLFAVHGFADEPVSRDAPLAEIEPAAEEEGSGSEPAEEILITLRVPLLAPLSASAPLASVEDEPITIEDLVGAIASSHADRSDAGAPVRRDYEKLLDRLITTRLIVQEARNIGFDELPEIAARIDDFSHQLLIQKLMSRELESVEADPAEVDRLYARMSREFLLETIEFEQEEDALAFQEQYESQGDFTRVAMRFFEEGKATGELGAEEYVKLKDLLPTVAQTADTLEVGAVSQIFTKGDGFLVFHVRDIRRYDDPGLTEEARRKVLEPLRRERAREYADWLERQHATIDYDLLNEVHFESRKEGLPFFRREVPADYEALLADDRVIATVHDDELFTVTVADLAQKVEKSFYHGVGKGLQDRKGAERRKTVTLKNLVLEKTAVIEARRQGLDSEPEYLDAVHQNTTATLFDVFVQKVIAPDVKIAEEEARKHYAEHIDDFSTPRMVRLNGLAFNDLPDAVRALDKLRRGSDFQWVSANSEGQADRDAERVLDFNDVLVSVNSLPEGIRAPAAGARRGDPLLYSAPDGNHYVIVVTKVFEPRPEPYDEARMKIAEAIYAEKIQALVAEWGVKLREAYEPRIYVQGFED